LEWSFLEEERYRELWNLCNLICVGLRCAHNVHLEGIGSVASIESLENAAQRTVYLITYSRADKAKFPCKEGFSSSVVKAWKSYGIRVVQWVVCIEAHTKDCESINEMNLYHYHMALKRGNKVQ